MLTSIGASWIHRRPIRAFSVRTRTYPLATTPYTNYSFRARIPCRTENLLSLGVLGASVNRTQEASMPEHCHPHLACRSYGIYDSIMSIRTNWRAAHASSKGAATAVPEMGAESGSPSSP